MDLIHRVIDFVVTGIRCVDIEMAVLTLTETIDALKGCVVTVISCVDTDIGCVCLFALL